MNYDNFSCLVFWTQNANTPKPKNIPGAKCANTPKLYTTTVNVSLLFFHPINLLL